MTDTKLYLAPGLCRYFLSLTYQDAPVSDQVVVDMVIEMFSLINF